MRWTKLMLFGVSAALALGAATPAGAAATEWLVEGKALEGNQELRAFWLPSVTIATTISNVHMVVTCKGGEGTALLSPKDTGELAAGIGFSECSVVEPAACKVPVTNKSTAETVSLTETGEARLLTFKPKSGTAIIGVEVTECALEDLYTITGTVGCEIAKPLTGEVTKNCVLTPGKDQELKFGTHTMSVTAEVSLAMAGADKGKSWSVS